MPGNSLERNKEGVPAYDGSAETLALFREEALAYTFTLEHHKRYLAGPRLAKELTGVARTVVRRKLSQDPQWLAHPRGAYVLIEYLEQAIESPTLVQASNHIHKFFYQLRRRKGETMTEWINRHSESMWEASRSLKRVQREHVSSHVSSAVSGSDSSRPQPPRGSTWGVTSQDLPEQPEVFDDRGRLPEDDDDDAERRSNAAWSSQSWKNYGWSDWRQGEWQYDDWQSWRSAEYQPPANWETDVQDFLPDFLTGFLLLNRSGLDAHERANILAAIRGEFSVKTVEKALKEQWRDDDLAKRDRAKQYANYANGEDDEYEEEGLTADLEAPNPADDPQGYEAFMCEQQEIDQALEAIRDKKRTLKEARWRQSQVKMNRKFYPTSSYRSSMRSSPSTTTSASTQMEKCLSCGGRHKTSSCPSKTQKAHMVEEAAEVAFGAFEEEYAAPAAVDKTATVTQLLQKGKAIIDCGATSTLGSVDAIENLMQLNVDRLGRDRVSVDPSNRPTFRFGNNGVRDCISSVDLGVDIGEKVGKLQVHVHDVPNQPVLISVKALRKLGAVIDFSKNEILYKNVDPKAVVPLEVASNGHCLMPLGGDLLAGAKHRTHPFSSLAAE
eukprot:s378_g17.t1